MNYYLFLAITLFVYMTTWFFLSVVKKRNDVADIAWGLGFVVLAWTSLSIAQAFTFRGILVTLLVTIWGLRLSFHIYKRNKGKPEDHRYEAWRKQWKNNFFLRSYLQVFLLQGFFLFLIVQPVLLINVSQRSFTLLDIFGLGVWLIGFYFEANGDAQLAAFIHNPKNKGKLMESGLWKYSRHPNYFGEVTQWWGIFLLALSVQNSLFTVIGPITITIMILFVSGVPLLEKKSAEKIGWRAYKKRTSVFLPLPPKHQMT